jgi:hypothetical protein
MTLPVQHSLDSSLGSALGPIQKSLTPEVARVLAKMRVDQLFQNRLDELADKNTEGHLTPAEQVEYDHHLVTLSFITIMQSKARQWLREAKLSK